MYLNEDVWKLVLEYALDYEKTHRRNHKLLYEDVMTDFTDHVGEAVDSFFEEQDLCVPFPKHLYVFMDKDQLQDFCKFFVIRAGLDYLQDNCMLLARSMLPNAICVHVGDPNNRLLLTPNTVYIGGEEDLAVWLSTIQLEFGSYRRGWPVSKWETGPFILN